MSIDHDIWTLIGETPERPRTAEAATPNGRCAPGQRRRSARRVVARTGVDARSTLHFPKWTDGRAYSQARLLRAACGFAGEIRATGEVLVDMLPLMERTGFASAVLRADQDLADARAPFERFAGFYQGDVRERRMPLFDEELHEWARSTCTRAPRRDFDAKLAADRRRCCISAAAEHRAASCRRPAWAPKTWSSPT